jgi:hypothetical protein
MIPQKSNLQPSVDTRAGPDQALPEALLPAERFPVLPLVQQLCHALAIGGFAYCHWKSNDQLERSASGDNDLDLLISRADGPRFSELLSRLGFRLAVAPAEKRLPGVLDYFGYDREADRFIHVHAHYQLFLGHDMAKNYRLHIERPYLASSTQGELFRVPAPDFEYIVFVIRMVLKHATWDANLGRQGSLNAAERRELAYLRERTERARVDELLKRHLPHVGAELFQDCVAALHPSCSVWTRMATGQRLQNSLWASARRPAWQATLLKLWRRVAMAIRRRVYRRAPKYRLASGGALIALIGGDGAGKSTAVNGLYDWLSRYFDTTRVHMGRPAWSVTTTAVRGMVKVGQLLGLYPAEASMRVTLEQKSLVSPGYPWLLREVCRARDRCWTYAHARRFAARGGLALLDRYPLSRIQIMDGQQTGLFIEQLMEGPRGQQFLAPRPASRLASMLVEMEERYYRQIVRPELLIVLRVDPEIAVQRRASEDATLVRERTATIWDLVWDEANAHVIDAGKSKEAVLAELKDLIWSEL